MSETRHRYVICIANVLDPRWSAYFGVEDSDHSRIQRREGMSGTQIIVSVVDQTELIGMVNILHDFGMKIDCVINLQAVDAGMVLGSGQDVWATLYQ